jgi:hypothetical protein
MHLTSWSSEQLRQQRLSQISYFLAPNASLSRIIFGFTADYCAPPSNTYKFQPNKTELLPKDREIREMRFDMEKDLLFAITLLDERKEDCIMQIKQFDLPLEKMYLKSKSITFAAEEHIFAMNVATKGNNIT